jgi:hypothetical protein
MHEDKAVEFRELSADCRQAAADVYDSVPKIAER